MDAKFVFHARWGAVPVQCLPQTLQPEALRFPVLDYEMERVDDRRHAKQFTVAIVPAPERRIRGLQDRKCSRCADECVRAPEPTI